MSDNFTEVTNQSWFSRLGGAIKGIIFGIILIIISFPLLFWNEGRAVKTYKTLKEGSGAVISVSAEGILPDNEGKLIHVTGNANTLETVTDDMFGITLEKTIKLKRSVEMYQWKEHSKSKKEKKVGGGTKTTTTYSYTKEWSNSHINSNNFKKSGEHQNPDSIPYSSTELTSDIVNLGDFQLTPQLISKITNYSRYPIEDKENEEWSNLRPYNNYLYEGNNPSSPAIGDVRISFYTVKDADVSIIAQQKGSTFSPYQTKAGGTIEMLSLGTHTAESMFKTAQTQNKILTWILRFVGFLLMFIGFKMIFSVLSVIADVLPILGSIVSAGTGIIAFLAALLFSTCTIAVAWITYRPILGISLLAIGIVSIILIRGKLKKV